MIYLFINYERKYKYEKFTVMVLRNFRKIIVKAYFSSSSTNYSNNNRGLRFFLSFP